MLKVSGRAHLDRPPISYAWLMKTQFAGRRRIRSGLLGLIAAVVLAACTQGGPSRPGGDAGLPKTAAMAGAGPTIAPLPARQPLGGSLDPGRVATTDPSRAPYRAGPQQWVPVAFSEAHALRAIKTGTLSLPLPGGGIALLLYKRHVVHPDGDWTFFGTGPGGTDAVITFGAEAVFGSMQTPSGTVRLTTDARGGWLVGGPGGEDGNRPGSDDMVLPPAFVRPQNNPRVTAKDSALAQASDSPPVIDLVVGFTPGLAQARGGESAARTRINNLVEVTNQAYANSGVQARVRLVHAMQVDFADATGNSDALSKLTGFKSGTGAIAVDPALQPLRAARDTYNGDLVVLLRTFRTPESDGCGIAWLLGSRGRTIEAADEAFGYSVVADGSDLDEGDNKTYFCREETFAHELGHLMGQTHNLEDSTSAGAHPYSYGYRQPSTTGFYTVMAYRLPDSSQFTIRHFANPSVNYNGAPTGVPDAADNVRSMVQTMPIVAAFRVVPVSTPAPEPPPAIARQVLYDVNGDGRSDIFLRGDTALAFWAMNGTTRTFDSYLGTGGTGWRVVAFGNFDGAAGADVLWANGTQMKIWFNMGGGSYVVYPMGAYGSGYEPFAAADVNGDGKSDILLRAGTSIMYWLLDGATVTGTGVAGDGGAGFRVVTTGDFTRDGADEIVWASATQVKMWINGRSAGFSPVIVGTYGNGYVPYAAGYVDGDASLDLLFIGGTAAAYWKLNGPTLVSSAYLGDGGAGFVPFAVGDYNGDGLSDIGWQNGATIKFWMNGGAAGYTPGIVGNYVCCYVPIGIL